MQYIIFNKFINLDTEKKKLLINEMLSLINYFLEKNGCTKYRDYFNTDSNLFYFLNCIIPYNKNNEVNNDGFASIYDINIEDIKILINQLKITIDIMAHRYYINNINIFPYNPIKYKKICNIHYIINDYYNNKINAYIHIYNYFD